jgi:hypothetical protein
MKRFTDSEKWSDPWFVELDPKSKLFWIYLLDKVDQSGVWEKFERKFQFETGIGISLDALIEDLGDRVQDLGDKILIPKFVRFQYGEELSESSNFHRGIFKRLAHHGLELDDEGFVKGCSRVAQGLLKGRHSLQDKDKDKNKDKKKGDARGRKEPELPFDDPIFVQAWNDYLSMRRDAKFKKLGATAIKAKFKDFEEWGLDASVESLKESTRSQWQGTFHPTARNGQPQTQKERNILDVLE